MLNVCVSLVGLTEQALLLRWAVSSPLAPTVSPTADPSPFASPVVRERESIGTALHCATSRP